MKENGLKRIVVMTAFGVGDSEAVGVPSSIARADVADFMVDACGSTKWAGKAVPLGG